jgi:chromosome segregation ATPase
MGKKVKPKSLLEGSTTYVDNTPLNNNINDDNSSVDTLQILNKTLSNTDQEKLEKYPAMEQQIIDLTNQNNELQAKIEELLVNTTNNTNESLAQPEEIEQLKSRISELEYQLITEKNKCASKTIKFEDEIQMLRNENDNYLVKISELSFDNARMTCELNELTKSIKDKTETVINQPKFTPTNNNPVKDPSTLGTPFRNPYNPYANNGYGTW